MNRDEALALVERHLGSSANLMRHSLASEAVLRALALKLGKPADEAERWALLGLLHDLDYMETADEPQNHGPITVQRLGDGGFSPEELMAISRHNAEVLGLKRESDLDLALTAGEVVTGLIVAAALVRPDKKISELKASSVIKKMKDKAFARSVNRDHIRLCEQIGLPLADFVALAITAMSAIEDRLNL
ncbi:MAG: hydrolase [Candidatus Adiutrix sp.]|jgi:predicted hydrolase (HD superfamily)|nr:hydrolase [Candidatus Adiutrix sp.]